MLGIHDLGFARRDAKELGIETRDVGQSRRLADIMRISDEGGVDAGRHKLIGGERIDCLNSVDQQLPEFFGTVGAGKAAGHADQRDVAVNRSAVLLFLGHGSDRHC